MSKVATCQSCKKQPALHGMFFSHGTLGLDYVTKAFYNQFFFAAHRAGDALSESISICWECLKPHTACKQANLAGDCFGKILLCARTLRKGYADRTNIDLQIWCSHHLYSDAGMQYCDDVLGCKPSNWIANPIYVTGRSREVPWREFVLNESDFLSLPPGAKEVVEMYLDKVKTNA